MVTDAGVFRELAIWAIRQIEGELFDKGFGIRGGLDLDYDWEVVASGDALIGKKAASSRIQSGWRRSPLIRVPSMRPGSNLFAGLAHQ